jgi:hypothetical protein
MKTKLARLKLEQLKLEQREMGQLKLEQREMGQPKLEQLETEQLKMERRSRQWTGMPGDPTRTPRRALGNYTHGNHGVPWGNFFTGNRFFVPLVLPFTVFTGFYVVFSTPESRMFSEAGGILRH